jgi:hypothetical protein
MFEDVGRALQRRAWPVAKAAWQHLYKSHRSARFPKLTVFVSGLQRSGTNMVMDIYEGSLRTEVFHETDRRVFDDYQHREQSILHKFVSQSPAPVVVIKALLEGHRLRQLLNDFAPARAIWMYRHFDDTVNSMLARWPGGRNFIDQIVTDRSSGEWRALGMSDQTYTVIKSHYSPDMTDASAQALTYYYRHQLFYDQCLDRDPRVLLMSYEDLISAPVRNVETIARFSSIPCTSRMQRHIHGLSIRRASAPDISADIRGLVAEMYEKLQATRLTQT